MPSAVPISAPSLPGRTSSTGTPDRNSTDSGTLRRNSCHSGPQLYVRNENGITPISWPSGPAADPSRTYQRRRSNCTHGMSASRYPAESSSA